MMLALVSASIPPVKQSLLVAILSAASSPGCFELVAAFIIFG
jgi:hypothetical protein